MVIRKATPNDRPAIANLLMVIFRDMELAMLKKVSEEELVDMLVQAMAEPTYRYNESRGLVEEIDGQVAGIAFGYPSEQEAIIDQAWLPVAQKHLTGDVRLFTDPEGFPNEWYIDSVCVHPDFRGHGIGTSLLQAVRKTAKQAGKDKMGLCCDFANVQAKKLYERLGFAVVGEQVLSNHPYYHMQKPIE